MPSTTAQDARRELAIRIATSLDVSARHEVGRAKFWLSDVEMGIVLDALRAEPARGAEDMRERAARCAETVEAWCEYVNIGETSSDGIAKAIRALPLTQDTQGESDG